MRILLSVYISKRFLILMVFNSRSVVCHEMSLELSCGKLRFLSFDSLSVSCLLSIVPTVRFRTFVLIVFNRLSIIFISIQIFIWAHCSLPIIVIKALHSIILLIFYDLRLSWTRKCTQYLILESFGSLIHVFIK